MSHFVNKYIGLPWKADCYGPVAFDCWGLVRTVLNKHYGKQPPIFENYRNQTKRIARVIKGQLDSESWTRIDKPVDGCLVALSKAKSIHHVGIYINIDGGKILHTQQGCNAICVDRQGLKNQGFSRIEFYLYGDDK